MAEGKPSRGEAASGGQGLTPEQLRIVVTLGFCGLVSAADNWFVSPALPAIANTLAIAPAAATVVLTAYMLPYGLLQPVSGSAADALGRLRMLRIIVLGLGVGTVLCALVTSLPALVLARVVTGCFAAGIIAVAQAFINDTVDPHNRAAAVSILMGVTFTGQGLSAGLGGILTDLVGWRAAFWAFGALALIAFLLLLTLKEPPRRTVPAAAGAAAAAPDSKTSSNPVSSFLRNAVRVFLGHRRGVYILALATGVLFLGTYGLMGTFLAQVCGLSSTHSGLLMMFYGIACMVGGPLSSRVNAQRSLPDVIRIGAALGAEAALALVVSTITGSWVPALIAALCLGFGYIFVQPSLATMAMDADPERVGLSTGLIGFGVFVGGGIGSSLGGVLLSSGGYFVLWGAALVGLVLQLLTARSALRQR